MRRSSMASSRTSPVSTALRTLPLLPKSLPTGLNPAARCFSVSPRASAFGKSSGISCMETFTRPFAAVAATQPHASTTTLSTCDTQLFAGFAPSLPLLRYAPAPVSGSWFHRPISNPGHENTRSLSEFSPRLIAYFATFRSFASSAITCCFILKRLKRNPDDCGAKRSNP